MKLSAKAVDFAKMHIKYFYDSDFFPKAFEFQGLFHNWDEVSYYLTTTDIDGFNVKKPIFLPAPKAVNGFRIVHQLDPLDSLIYTALAFQIADSVEKKRVNKADRVVCSYRIKVDGKGNFFSEGSGYEDFKSKSIELASRYSYVLVGDITDFYNQICHHRVQNALEVCDKNLKELASCVERFLSKLTNKMSKGVPVGPAASIIMSEAVLNDIDDFILDKQSNYVRYVDDIRIFSDSKEKLEDVLHALTSYLYSNHRLNLASNKTKILTSNDFVKTYIENHEEIERQEIHKALEELRIVVNAEYPNFEPADIVFLPDDNKVKAQGKAFISLMDRITGFETLDLGLARHVLRRAKALRTRVILKPLLNNFDFFTPVLRDVVLYLESVLSEKAIKYHQHELAAIVQKSNTIRFPYVSYWMGYLFAQRKIFSQYPDIKQFNSMISSTRLQALQAITNESISWVREHKDRIDQFGPWDKRAIINSAQILSRDERTHWMDSIIDAGDLLDRSLAMYIKSR